MHYQGELAVLTEVKCKGKKVVTVFAKGTEIGLQDKIAEIKSGIMNPMTHSFKTAKDEAV